MKGTKKPPAVGAAGGSFVLAAGKNDPLLATNQASRLHTGPSPVKPGPGPVGQMLPWKQGQPIMT